MKPLRNLFYGFIALVIFIIIIEGLFRLFGAGHPAKLLKKVNTSYGSYYVFNEYSAFKYYSRLNKKSPKPLPHLFAAEKPDSVYRIVVLGESTSRGFPHGKLEAFPGQVQQMITSAGCDKTCEVINLSMTAVNSAIGADLAKDIQKCNPDLVLVYFGHSEFNKKCSSLNYCLSYLRSYQSVKLMFSKKTYFKDRTVFGNATQLKEIPYGSKTYKKTLTDFEKHYTRIVRTFRQKDIPVICMGVVKNKKDFPPLNINNGTIDFEKVISDSANFETNFKTIADTLTSAPEMYRFGQALVMHGFAEKAGIVLDKACDYDETRLRAPAEVNAIIRNISEKNDCYYIDIQKIFDSLSMYKITGNHLMLDHIHPSLLGHQYIAMELTRKIIREVMKCEDYYGGFYKITIQSSLPDMLSSADLMKSFYDSKTVSAVSYFNPHGINRIYNVHETPGGREYSYLEPGRIKEFEVLEKIRKRNPDVYAWHVNYGIWFHQNHDLQKAIREFRLAYHLNPVSPTTRNNYALLAFELGRTDEALQILKETLETGNKDKRIAYNLVWIYTQLKREEEARAILKKYDRKRADISLDKIGASLLKY